MEVKEQEGIVALENMGLWLSVGSEVSSVKNTISASRQGLGGPTGGWESKKDQEEGEPGHKDIFFQVLSNGLVSMGRWIYLLEDKTLKDEVLR